MDKEQKAQVVEEIASRLGESEAIFAIDYRGISVPQAAELRGALREADASFNIVKNRLAKRAAEQAGKEGLDELLEGPTALTYVRGDVVTAAKAISTFNREHEVLTFKGGFMNGDPVDEDRFKALSRLPSLEVMHGQLVGTIASPITGLARGLGSMLSGLAVALGQIQEQGLVTGEAPAEEEKPTEEPAAEAEETPAEEPSAGSDPSPEETLEPEEAQGSDPTESGEVTPEDTEEETPEEPQAEAETETPAEAEAADEEASDEEPEDQPADDPAAPGGEAEEADGSDVESEGDSGEEGGEAADAAGSDVSSDSGDENEEAK